MKFSVASTFVTLLAVATAATVETPEQSLDRRAVLLMERQGANGNRPVPEGSCCVGNLSLKQDVCRVNGQNGRCVPSSSANCNARLTCIQDSALTCDPNRQERGRPFCRPSNGRKRDVSEAEADIIDAEDAEEEE